MATGKALDGKPYEGSPHVRFDGGKVVLAAMPRRVSLLYKTLTQTTLRAAFAAVSIAPLAVHAYYTEFVNGYEWPYIINGGTAEIQTVDFVASGNLIIPSTLGGKPVTRIGEWAFNCCEGLTSVTIPDSVISIGGGAFEGRRELTSVTIPASVTSISSGAFRFCSGLKSVTIPDSVTSIGNEAFYGCNAALFDTATIPGVNLVDGWAVGYTDYLSGALDLAGVRGIADSAFYYCSELTSVTIPESVKGIGGWAFFGCSGLTSVTFKGNAPNIGSRAFEGVGDGCTAYVKRGSSGWGVAIPGEWQGIRIAYVDGGVDAGPGNELQPATGLVTPGNGVFINAEDVTAPYEAPKAVVLKGAAYDAGGAAAGIVELKLGKVSNGKGKVSGSFTGLDGKKAVLKIATVTGIDGTAPAKVSLDVKGHGTMAVTIGGAQFAGSLGGWHVQSGAVGGNLGGNAVVSVAANDVSMFAGEVQTSLLPKAERVLASGGKWAFDKAAVVKWAKPGQGVLPAKYDAESGKGLIVDDTKGKTNLSGLKLTYAPKKGTFRGSFKVYALEGSGKATKLKKYTVNVTGLVVDGVGYGVATCKKPVVSWAVTVR